MRLQVATLRDVYSVHKTYAEFLNDNARQKKDEMELYKVWPERLTSPEFRYVLLMHSRKVIGMIWGRELRGEIEKTFLIEGRFLRRAYKGKMRFQREMIMAQREITKDFTRTMVINLEKRPKMQNKVLGVLIDKGQRGGH